MCNKYAKKKILFYFKINSSSSVKHILKTTNAANKTPMHLKQHHRLWRKKKCLQPRFKYGQCGGRPNKKQKCIPQPGGRNYKRPWFSSRNEEQKEVTDLKK